MFLASRSLCTDLTVTRWVCLLAARRLCTARNHFRQLPALIALALIDERACGTPAQVSSPCTGDQRRACGRSPFLVASKLMGGRRYRRQEQSLRKRVQEHVAKIEAERSRSFPDEQLIAYWQREIRAFEQGIARAQRRQGRK